MPYRRAHTPIRLAALALVCALGLPAAEAGAATIAPGGTISVTQGVEVPEALRGAFNAVVVSVDYRLANFPLTVGPATGGNPSGPSPEEVALEKRLSEIFREMVRISAETPDTETYFQRTTALRTEQDHLSEALYDIQWRQILQEVFDALDEAAFETIVPAVTDADIEQWLDERYTPAVPPPLTLDDLKPQFPFVRGPIRRPEDRNRGGRVVVPFEGPLVTEPMLQFSMDLSSGLDWREKYLLRTDITFGWLTGEVFDPFGATSTEVRLQPIPLPASGLLLAAALGPMGWAWTRRRRAHAA